MALGNFDGLHRGHQAIIRQTIDTAHGEGVAPAVMTFEPHPRVFFQPELKPYRIQRFRSKAAMLKEMGVAWMLVLRFNRALSQMPAELFIKDILVDALKVRHVIVGHDFIFGHRRQGNAELLREEGNRLGYTFTQVPPVSCGEEVCSSSRVRQLLKRGDMPGAAQILGRPYAVEGRVRRGDARGRELGFPTANLSLKGLLTPQRGVYAVRAARENGRALEGVANLGIRPTFGGKEEMLEVHLFDHQNEIYGERLTVQCLKQLRTEQRFDSAEALMAQIEKDCAQAKAVLQQPEGVAVCP